VAQHPKNPIPETLYHVPNFGTLTIYQIPASPFWQMRVYMDKHLIKRSTRTRHKDEAVAVAKKFYHTLLLRQDQSLPLTEAKNNVFERLCVSLQKEDQARIDRKEANPRLVKDQELIIRKDLIPYFGKTALRDINYNAISGYVQTLKERNLSSTTVKWHFTTLSKILQHAVRNQMLQQMPLFPKVKIERNPPAYFTKKEWIVLIDTFRECIKKGVKVRGTPITMELARFVTFMVASFLRVPDMKSLTNKLIESKQKGSSKYLLITATTKVKTRKVVTLQMAAEIYGNMQKINKQKGFDKPDDYVWLSEYSNRNTAMTIIRNQFNYVLKKAKLKVSPTGQVRVLTSLRHTAAMYAADNKDLPLKVLADNMRTSIDMLDKHYLSHTVTENYVKQIQGQIKDKPQSKPKN
jgi:site-specific recombinase XerD